jgi:hypothetical protein
MIIVKLIGGLGNQMFQYATAKALAVSQHKPLYVDATAFETYTLHQLGLQHFNLDLQHYKQPKRFVAKWNRFFKKIIQYHEQQFNYDISLQNIKNDILFLNGYFQSELYFNEYENYIREAFEIKSPLKKETRAALELMKKGTAVSLHIRRGDYLQHDIHNTNKEQYYRDAMEYIENKIEDVVYFIFSDDMDWVKENFKTNTETHYMDFNDAASNYEDLKLMSSCQHHIIANSSFSWWGAWLNPNPNKIVIAPKKWFNDETRNYKDVVPASWIKL